VGEKKQQKSFTLYAQNLMLGSYRKHINIFHIKKDNLLGCLFCHTIKNDNAIV
jgi:hypothetical protein